MNPEQGKHERFTEYAAMLREQFDADMLSELQDQPQWVMWRAELDDGKQKKVPYNPNVHLARASVKIPKTWGTLDQAQTALETGNYSGVGFMITPPLVMIDLDNSFDKILLANSTNMWETEGVRREVLKNTRREASKGVRHVLAHPREWNRSLKRRPDLPILCVVPIRCA